MNGTQTVGKALDILSAIAEAGTNLSVPEIAERVGIPESTTYRLLQTLEQNHVIERKAKGQISLGMKILDLARCMYQQLDRELCLLTRPIMEQLTEETGETTVLMVRTGLHIVCIQNVKSPRLIRFELENGRMLPVHMSASGKSILAYENERFIERVLGGLEEEDGRRKLKDELEEIRTKGYSLTIGEVDKDVFGLGLPVLDANGSILASLTIAGPVARFDMDLYREIAGKAGYMIGKISSKLGSR